MSHGDEDSVGPIGRVARSGPTEVADGAAAAGEAAAVTAVGEPIGDAALAEAIRAGELDAAAATRVLVEAVAREQLGPAASPEAVAALVAELSDLLEGDPTLEALLGR